MLTSILLLIVNTVLGFITLMLLARFFMQWQRAPFRNQIGHFVVTMTDWVVVPLRRFVPGLFGLDMASLLPAWLFQILLAAAEVMLGGEALGGHPGGVLLGIAGLGLIGLLRTAVYLVFGIVLVSAVLSWVNPHAPAAPVFHALAAPFLRPFRRIVPVVANVDLSPLALLLVLQIVLLVIGGLRKNFLFLLLPGGG